MALTSIGDQKTPGRPVEITFAAETGIPSDNKEVLLIGHKDAVSGTASAYFVTQINNAGDLTAASGEAIAKFGAGSELTKMVIAAIRAVAGLGTFPALKCVPLEASDTGFGPSDEALTAAKRVKAEYVVTPYDLHTETSLRDKLKEACSVMSGAQRVHNNQFGTFGVGANRNVADPSTLFMFDTQFLQGIYLRDTGTGDDAPAYSLGEVAAACAHRQAANGAPFNPLDDVTVTGIEAPAKDTDWISRGAGLESESVLNRGWTPMYVKPNGEVAFVRTVTGRISADGTGTPVVQSYYDAQDFDTLYLWRKTVYTRFSQPDFKQRKASAETANEIKSELIRLAKEFEDQQMFQAVDQLSKKFQVERSSSDRHRFDVKTPVNVVPGLHVIATNVEATTEFDELSI